MWAPLVVDMWHYLVQPLLLGRQLEILVLPLVVNVTSEDILLYIIIVFCYTLVGDVFPPFGMSLLCLVIEVKASL